MPSTFYKERKSVYSSSSELDENQKKKFEKTKPEDLELIFREYKQNEKKLEQEE